MNNPIVEMVLILRHALRKISGRERRFKKDANHCISKEIVNTAKDTNRAIALEDLSGIRERTTVSKAVTGCPTITSSNKRISYFSIQLPALKAICHFLMSHTKESSVGNDSKKYKMVALECY